MGRDKPEKQKRRHSSHHRHSSSSSDSSGESSSHSSDESTSTDASNSRSEEEYHHKSKKPKRSERDGSKHGHKHRSKHRKEHKTKLKKRKSRHDVARISMDDYYSKSSEFRSWLSSERGVFFSDMTSEQSRKMFKKFVNKWNSGLLKKKYYKGIQSATLKHGSQTNYKWKFASGINEKELQAMRESVSSWTSGSSKEEEDTRKRHPIGPSLSPPHPMIGPTIGPTIGPIQGASRSHDRFEVGERREEERTRLKQSRKETRKNQEMVLDELLPKATGREARFEKRKVRAEQRRTREISPDVGGSMLMGSSGDIGKKIQARQAERQSRAHAAQQKILDYQAKERARTAAILELAKANKKEGAMW